MQKKWRKWKCIVLTYRKQFIRKPYSEYKCCILSVKLNPQLFSCLLKLYHTTYPTSLNSILMRLTKKNVLSKMTSLQPHTALKGKKWGKWNCLISNKELLGQKDCTTLAHELSGARPACQREAFFFAPQALTQQLYY